MSANLSAAVDRFVETVRALLPPDADAAQIAAFGACLSDLLAEVNSAASVQAASSSRAVWAELERLRAEVEALRVGRTDAA